MFKANIIGGNWEDGTLQLSGMPISFVLSARKLIVLEIDEAGLLPMALNCESLEDWIQSAFKQTLAICGNNKRKAAKILKVSERTFYRKCKLFNI